MQAVRARQAARRPALPAQRVPDPPAAAARAAPRTSPLLAAALPRRDLRSAKARSSASRRRARSAARYRWPGNVRELRNVVQRAYVMAPGDEIVDECLPRDAAGARRRVRARRAPAITSRASARRWPTIERQLILATLEHFGRHKETHRGRARRQPEDALQPAEGIRRGQGGRGRSGGSVRLAGWLSCRGPASPSGSLRRHLGDPLAALTTRCESSKEPKKDSLSAPGSSTSGGCDPVLGGVERDVGAAQDVVAGPWPTAATPIDTVTAGRLEPLCLICM